MSCPDPIALINAIVPIVAVVLALRVCRRTRWLELLVPIPSLLYMSGFYIAYIIIRPTDRVLLDLWRVLLRYGLTTLLVSILIYTVVLSIKVRRIDETVREIEENRTT